jgi:hypothetical protein
VETNGEIGKITLWSRLFCSILICSPVLYRFLVAEGDTYHFFVLVIVSPLAGVVLFANSLFHLVRTRSWRSVMSNITFILISIGGVLVSIHYLPQFRM